VVDHEQANESAMRKIISMLLLAATTTFTTNAWAEIDLCKAVALRDVPAIEDQSSIIKRGDSYTAISQYNVNKKTGVITMCSHGGYCYPTQVIEGGRRVEALRLTNCKIGKPSYHDADETSYELILDRRSVSPAELKQMDVSNKLLAMGLCNACADNATEYYLKQPASRCARLVRRVLQGDRKALNVLKGDFPSYCNFHY
jgi:hypothetical protein